MINTITARIPTAAERHKFMRIWLLVKLKKYYYAFSFIVIAPLYFTVLGRDLNIATVKNIYSFATNIVMLYMVGIIAILTVYFGIEHILRKKVFAKRFIVILRVFASAASLAAIIIGLLALDLLFTAGDMHSVFKPLCILIFAIWSVRGSAVYLQRLFNVILKLHSYQNNIKTISKRDITDGGFIGRKEQLR